MPSKCEGSSRDPPQATVTATCPASENVIVPAQVQLRVALLLSAGIEAISTAAEPGAQGAVVKGMQGWGVKTPAAAEVAAATWGLAGLWHMPKGGIFIIGTKSLIVPAGTLPVVTGPAVALNTAGLVPIVQLMFAPVQH